MSDLIFLVIVVAFFALATGLMRACESIIGPDAPTSGTTTPAPATTDDAEVPA